MHQKTNDTEGDHECPEEEHSDGNSTSKVDPYAGLPPLKRPRKTVYKSTLQKRNREKRRRELFQEGLQQLSEIVFQGNPTIASGRDIHIESSSTITNRGDLVRTAVGSMKQLMDDVAEQKQTIAELEETLARKQSMTKALSQANPLVHSGVINNGHPPDTILNQVVSSPILPNLSNSAVGLSLFATNNVMSYPISNAINRNPTMHILNSLQNRGRSHNPSGASTNSNYASTYNGKQGYPENLPPP